MFASAGLGSRATSSTSEGTWAYVCVCVRVSVSKFPDANKHESRATQCFFLFSNRPHEIGTTHRFFGGVAYVHTDGKTRHRSGVAFQVGERVFRKQSTAPPSTPTRPSTATRHIIAKCAVLCSIGKRSRCDRRLRRRACGDPRCTLRQPPCPSSDRIVCNVHPCSSSTPSFCSTPTPSSSLGKAQAGTGTVRGIARAAGVPTVATTHQTPRHVVCGTIADE